MTKTISANPTAIAEPTAVAAAFRNYQETIKRFNELAEDSDGDVLAVATEILVDAPITSASDAYLKMQYLRGEFSQHFTLSEGDNSILLQIQEYLGSVGDTGGKA